MHNFSLAVSQRPKKKGHYMLTMTIAALTNYVSLFITTYIACYTAPLKNTVTALLEYQDLTALLEYVDLLNRYSRGP